MDLRSIPQVDQTISITVMSAHCTAPHQPAALLSRCQCSKVAIQVHKAKLRPLARRPSAVERAATAPFRALASLLGAQAAQLVLAA